MWVNDVYLLSTLRHGPVSAARADRLPSEGARSALTPAEAFEVVIELGREATRGERRHLVDLCVCLGASSSADGVRNDTSQFLRRLQRAVEEGQLVFFRGWDRDPPAREPASTSGGPSVPEVELEASAPRRIRTPPATIAPAPAPPPEVNRVAVQLTEIRGLYKPGHHDQGDLWRGTCKRSGYLPGYKSGDDQGRIFVNQLPRTSSGMAWDSVKKKNKQYIELVATIDVLEGVLPAGCRVLWRWSDPDDPSDRGMREDAAEVLDPNDGRGEQSGVDGSEEGDDNQGECDFPSPRAGRQPAFEQLDSYALTPGAAASRSCWTTLSDLQTGVRFHVTDAGGDNFRIEAVLEPMGDLVIAGGGDQTGVMTVWKRIDDEYRRMDGAHRLPMDEVAEVFEKYFVQMDVAPEQPTVRHARYLSDLGLQPEFVNQEFKNAGTPGWFFVCAAREAERPAGSPRQCLYEGPGLLTERGPRCVPPTKIAEIYDQPPYWETVVVDATIAKSATIATFKEGDQRVQFFIERVDRERPVPGKSTLHISSIDYQSEAQPSDGALKNAYDSRAFYSPRFRYRWPEGVWEPRGYGFPETVYVNVVSRGPSAQGGVSPDVGDAAGKKYFAGRTIVFTGNPGFVKPASATLDVVGDWAPGDVVRVTIAGLSAAYTVSERATRAPSEALDPQQYANGQVARGIERAINRHPILSTRFTAQATFGRVRVRSATAGSAGDGVPISVTVDHAPQPQAERGGGGGEVLLSGDSLRDGGVDARSQAKMVSIVIHELGHAFGLPHKCGYPAAGPSASTSCVMNYFHTWLYSDSRRRDAANREVERFNSGQEGNAFCAMHARCIRLGRLEDNPVMWKWQG